MKQVQAGRIVINPFDPCRLNPNSYNFRLGKMLKFYDEPILDPKRKNKVRSIEIDTSGYALSSDRIYLGHTEEIMGSNHFVPIVKGRSSTARLGLFVHVTADLIDIGSINQWTLQLHAVQEIRVYPEMLIGQVTFWQPIGDIVLYTGKYQGSRGPVESLSWKEFGGETE